MNHSALWLTNVSGSFPDTKKLMYILIWILTSYQTYSLTWLSHAEIFRVQGETQESLCGESYHYQPPCFWPVGSILHGSISHLKYMGMSENGVYPQWNSHLVGIMISKTIGCRGTQHFQTNPYPSRYFRKLDPVGTESFIVSTMFRVKGNLNCEKGKFCGSPWYLNELMKQTTVCKLCAVHPELNIRYNAWTQLETMRFNRSHHVKTS